jgi:hypothetical protein
MRWFLWPILILFAFWLAVKAIGILASLALNPWRKRIRDGFVSDLRRLRPNIDLAKVDSQYLLIRTPTALARFELAGLYNDVMNAKPHTEENIREICSNYLRGLLPIIDRTPTQNVMENKPV